MNISIIGLGILLIAVFVWLTGIGKSPRTAAPEDDMATPIDREELEAAERELAEAEDSAPLDDASDDDWGPGTGGSSPLPGIR